MAKTLTTLNDQIIIQSYQKVLNANFINFQVILYNIERSMKILN